MTGTDRPEKKIITQKEFDSMKAGMKSAFKTLENTVGENGEWKSKGTAGFTPMDFVLVERKYYSAEFGCKQDDFIFHIFVTPEVQALVKRRGEDVGEILGDAFKDVFKRSNTVSGDYSPELHSWAIRVIGYAPNSAAEVLINKLFDDLDSYFLAAIIPSKIHQ